MGTVTATGHGAGRAVPDSAVVRVAVVARAAELASAFERSAELAHRLRAAALEHVEEPRISTSGIQVWPRHDHEGRRDGFEARHGFALACADLSSAGALLAGLVAALGDELQVEDVSLAVADPAAARAEAREAAFADARAAAEQLAALAGARLGEVVQVAEGGAPASPGPRMAMVAAEAPISPGEQSVGTSVQVTWALDG